MTPSPVPSKEEDVPLLSLISPSDIDRNNIACKLCKDELLKLCLFDLILDTSSS